MIGACVWGFFLLRCLFENEMMVMMMRFFSYIEVQLIFITTNTQHIRYTFVKQELKKKLILNLIRKWSSESEGAKLLRKEKERMFNGFFFPLFQFVFFFRSINLGGKESRYIKFNSLPLFVFFSFFVSVWNWVS